MKNRISACLLLASAICVPAAFQLQAQDSDFTYNQFTVGAEAGTTGLGGYAGWRFVDHFGVHGGADYFHYTKTGSIQDSDYQIALRLESAPLTLDWFPSKTSTFHVSVGGLWNDNRVGGTGTPSSSDTFNLNGQTFTGSQVGTLQLNIQQQRFDPYVSIGGNFFTICHHVGLGGELGVFYTGKPRVTLSNSGGTGAPGLAAAIQGEQDKVTEYAKKVEFWPVLKLFVNVSF